MRAILRISKIESKLRHLIRQQQKREYELDPRKFYRNFHFIHSLKFRITDHHTHPRIRFVHIAPHPQITLNCASPLPVSHICGITSCSRPPYNDGMDSQYTSNYRDRNDTCAVGDEGGATGACCCRCLLRNIVPLHLRESSRRKNDRSGPREHWRWRRKRPNVKTTDELTQSIRSRPSLRNRTKNLKKFLNTRSCRNWRQCATLWL